MKGVGKLLFLVLLWPAWWAQPAAAQDDPAKNYAGPPLGKAILRGQLDEVHRLLRLGVSPNQGALHLAVLENKLEIAAALLSKGADPNLILDRSAPLETALRRRLRPMMDLLLRHGADPELGVRQQLEDDPWAGPEPPLVAALDASLFYGAPLKEEWLEGYLARTRPSLEQRFLAALSAPRYSQILLQGQAIAADWPNGSLLLHRAATLGRVDLLERLLQAGVEPGQDALGRSPLMKARAGAVAPLVAAGVDPNRRLEKPEAGFEVGAGALEMALVQRDWPAATALIEAGAQADYQLPHSGMTPLHLVVRAFDSSRSDLRGGRPLALLLDRGARPDRRDLMGRTPLILSRYQEHRQALLDAGADPLAQSFDGSTVWHTGPVLGGRPRGEFQVRDALGRTALHWQVYNGSVLDVRRVLGSGVNPNLTDHQGLGALHLLGLRLERDLSIEEPMRPDPLAAHLKQAHQILALLLGAGADPNLGEGEAGTALHFLPPFADELVEQLLQAGAHPDALDSEGRSVLLTACRFHPETLRAQRWAGQFGEPLQPDDRLRRQSRTVELLLAAEADYTRRDSQQRSPLFWAAASGAEGACRALLRAGASAQRRDALGQSLLDAAEYSLNREVAALFLTRRVQATRPLPLVEMNTEPQAEPPATDPRQAIARARWQSADRLAEAVWDWQPQLDPGLAVLLSGGKITSFQAQDLERAARSPLVGDEAFLLGVYRLGLEQQQATDYEEAELSFERLLEEAGRRRYHEWQLLARLSLSRLLILRGRLAQALGRLRPQQEEYGGARPGPTSARRQRFLVREALARLYDAAGRPGVALDYYQEALKEAGWDYRFGNGLESALQANIALADFYRRQQQTAAAEAAYLECLRGCPGNSRERADALLGLCQLYVDRQLFAPARPLFERARELSQKHPLLRYRCLALQASLDPKQAQPLLQEALSGYEQLGMLPAQLEILLRLSQLAPSADGAREYLLKAVNLLEERLGAGLDLSTRGSLVGRNRSLYEALLTTHLDERQAAPALAVVERARDQTLAQLFSPSGFSLRRGVSAELLAREEYLRNELERTVSGELNNPYRPIKVIKSEMRRLMQEIRAQSSALAARPRPAPLDQSRVVAALEPDTLILSFFVGEQRVYLWTLSNQGVRYHPLEVTPLELRRLISRASRALRAKTNAEATLARLADKLLQPIAGELAGRRRLVVLPHDQLYYLPFQCLPWQNALLLENFEISYASSLRSWLERPAGAAAGDQVVVAALAESEVSLASHDSVRSGIESISNLKPLPGTRREALAVAELYPRHLLLLGDQMTSAALRKASEKARVMHLATHGILDPSFPMLSGLVAADGLVTVSELLDWRLDCELVVLSACETAAGELGSGGEVVGLTSALQDAGARSVMATLWPISDQITSSWMLAFHRRRSAGISNSLAAREAALEVRKSHPEPFYWAPFVLYGE